MTEAEPADAGHATVGETVYVPVYPFVYTADNARPFNLAATLHVRNTDRSSPIVRQRGSLLRQRRPARPRRPDETAPGRPDGRDLSSFVKESDISAGARRASSSNGRPRRPVSEPVVEAVMVGTLMNQGIAFTSPGRVVERKDDSPTQALNRLGSGPERFEQPARGADVDDDDLARVRPTRRGRRSRAWGRRTWRSACARTATPSGTPRSASRPEGRSRARTGLPERLIASIAARKSPSTGRVSPVPSRPSTTQSAPASRASSRSGSVGGSSCQAVWSMPERVEDAPTGRPRRPGAGPGRRTRRPGRRSPRRRGAGRPRRRRRRCCPARRGSAPRRRAVAGRGRGAARPRPGRRSPSGSAVGIPNSSAARASMPRTSSRDSGRSVIGGMGTLADRTLARLG